MIRFASVCSGLEAATVAWEPLGWEPVFYSEIAKFPSAVLAHHYPTVPNLGDMNEFKSWPDYDFSVLVGGTPCQSFSVAGLRGGLADPRGNLALVYLAVADRYRPRWIVWENVPGVLSSHGGRDFGTFLGALAELGYGWAYRVLDAQHFGLAQRRKRVFVVGYLGDWRRAAAVLFEPASLRRDPPPRREARERIAASLTRGADSGGRGGYAGRRQEDDENIVVNALTERPDRGGTNSEGQRLVAPTIPARTCGGGGLGTDFDCDGGLIQDWPAEVAPTLNAHFGDKWGLEDQHAMNGAGLFVPVAFDTTQVTSDKNYSAPKGGDPCHPLAAGAHPPAIAFQWQASQSQSMNPSEVCSSLDKSKSPAVLDTFRNQGYSLGYASPQERNSGEVLRRVRKEIGEEAFAEWGLGILDSLRTSQVLRPAVHGGKFRQAAFSRSWVVCCSLGSPISSSEGAMRSLREALREGCPPQGWEPLEQLSGELGAYLSELSRPGAQAERFVFDLRQADEGSRILREALPEVQAMGRSAGVQEKPAHSACQVRRLNPMEAEFLQGFPRNYTLIPNRGKPAADGPRYQALGNSMAVPCIRWIGKRIQLVDSQSERSQ